MDEIRVYGGIQSNRNDIVAEYQQYQDATADEEVDYEGETEADYQDYQDLIVASLCFNLNFQLLVYAI